MSIHQSKGLEFPVVAVADLAKAFNRQDLHGEIIFDEAFGLCPRVKPPQTGRRYPSLPHWLAQRHQRREQAGEELRLLYVALTRARDVLILAGSVTENNWGKALEKERRDHVAKNSLGQQLRRLARFVVRATKRRK
ncbi:MAG: 3'-5' exonuclease [Limisphaerales bacterium]